MNTQAEQETNESTNQVDLEAAANAENEPSEGAGDSQEPGEEETVVSIGEEAPPPEETTQAPEWVRELRRKHRETVKELEKANKKLEALTVAPAPTLSKKPTMEDEGIDYDPEKYEAAMERWFKEKRKVEEEEAKAKQAEEAANVSWKSKLESYGKAKSDLKLKDFDEAEAEAEAILTVTQRGIIVQGSKNAAALIYALGKDRKEGQRIAAIKDPVEFAWEVATLEATKLKVTKKNAPPPPERQVNGTGRTSGTVDSTLERLRNEAEKSGDFTKVIRYKAEMRAKTKT